METQTADAKASFHPLFAVEDGIINLYGGKTMNLLSPNQSDIDIVNIAGALSKFCRFGGQVGEFYSVAQHCVLVAYLAPNHLRKEALMHDASEAWLGDVTKPVKELLGDAYKTLEQIAMSAVSKKFGLSQNDLLRVKPYDKQATEIEHFLFQREELDFWKGPVWLRKPWAPKFAELMFLEWADKYVL